MRSILIALTLAASAFLPAAAEAGASECLPSGAAVFAAHPNAAHASWEGRSHPGQRCWYMDSQIGAHLREGLKREADNSSEHRISTEADGPTRPSSVSTPVPRKRPESAPPATEPAPAPVQIADLAPNQPLRNAMESYVVDQYWVLMWRARN